MQRLGWLGSVVALAGALAWGCGGGGGDEDASTGDGGSDAGPDDDGGAECRADDECDDGLFCNGTETCTPGASDADAMGCVAGEPPCSGDRDCDEESARCVTACDREPDADGDGHDAVECGGDDCDDGDADRFPGNTEVCDLEGHDEDCDPTTIGDRDADNDGYVDDRCCNTDDAGDMTCGDDCNDGRSSTHPGASEVCDGIDNDCDGMTDEGVKVSGFEDLDHDLHGNPDAPLEACPDTPGFATVGDDCDDDDPRRHEAQVEICDMVDNDCDGKIDESPGATTWYGDADGDGFGSPDTATQVSCEPLDGFSLLPTDCDDTRSGVNPGADEQCNGRDDDCNGEADFVISSGNTEDDDGDGFADDMCATGSDCDDNDASTHPGATELCDGRDNDCDGVSDDGTEDTEWYPDLDGDGWGDPAGPIVMACEPPAGHTLRSGDCDDSNAEINPDATDDCDGTDDDCDGIVDEDVSRQAYYPDADGDGYGDDSMAMLSCMEPADLISQPGDCDDSDASINPTGTEECNGLDDDCDEIIDEGFGDTTTCGLGECEVTVGECEDGAPVTECVPGEPSPEECNGLDDNCDGTVDNEPAASESCADPTTTIASCDSGSCTLVGCVSGFGDCNAALSDGCETDLTTSTMHCGECGHGCATGDSCVDGVCQTEPIDIDGGENHTCVLVGSGDVWCWGANGRGQLGDGTTSLRSSAVQAGISAAASQVGAGWDQTCAVMADGTIECWGENGNKQVAEPGLGNPILTPTRATDLTDAVSIDLGARHSCTLRSSGLINCWGNASSGRLGGGCGRSNCAPSERVRVRNIDVASLFTLGGAHAVAQRTSPSVTTVAWGEGSNGRLAHGGEGDRNSADATTETGGATVNDALDIGTGRAHSCIVRSDGKVWCAGKDDWGQIGEATDDSSDNLRFTEVASLTNVEHVWSGFDHNCALTTAGGLFCWGRNLEGQIDADVAEDTVWTPVEITDLPGTVVDMGLGLTHTCAILDTFRVVCWGANGSGQLGAGDTDPKSDPVFVTGLP